MYGQTVFAADNSVASSDIVAEKVGGDDVVVNGVSINLCAVFSKNRTTGQQNKNSCKQTHVIPPMLLIISRYSLSSDYINKDPSLL